MIRENSRRSEPRALGALLAVALTSMLALSACETPPVSERSLPTARESMRVLLLDDWFVRVDGERLARDEFLFRTRLACRAWASEQLSAPRIYLSWAEGEVGQPVVKDTIDQLNLAGIAEIVLGDG
jgi:hypothetical protein